MPERWTRAWQRSYGNGAGMPWAKQQRRREIIRPTVSRLAGSLNYLSQRSAAAGHIWPGPAAARPISRRPGVGGKRRAALEVSAAMDFNHEASGSDGSTAARSTLIRTLLTPRHRADTGRRGQPARDTAHPETASQGTGIVGQLGALKR